MGYTKMIENPLDRLSEEQVEELGKEFDKIHDEVFAELGERDRKYIIAMIEMHRRLVVAGRVVLLFSRHRPAWVAGTTLLGMAKILENMEIGHNVMHGQWDWMNDPKIHSSAWDWDTASTKEAWKHSHNYIHHTYTNILGKDKDLGYEIFRVDPHQKWHPFYLLQPFYNILLMLFFEWGVALHDLELEEFRRGQKSTKAMLEDLKGISGKARLQFQKDYVAWPLLSAVADGALTYGLKVTGLRGRAEKEILGRRTRAKKLASSVRRRAKRRTRDDNLQQALDSARQTFKTTNWANFTANIVRNIWSNAIIFCGHFPDQTYVFTPEEVENESRGAWYVRQLIGAANIDGSPIFHVASGNLSYQVEHHLYPDMPSTRYGEIAPRVREICERYGLPYNTGPFFKQWGSVQRTILRMAFPGGKPTEKPGPYKGDAPPAGDETDLPIAA